MSKQNNADFTQKLWVRVLCGFLGALMVFGIVAMVISAAISSVAEEEKADAARSTYAVEKDEISVGLYYSSTAVQSYTLSSDGTLTVKNDLFSVDAESDTVVVSVDDNEYYYNGKITNNPMGVSVLGGYHVRISFLQSGGGTSSPDVDNPVFIVPGVSGGNNEGSIFTKDNISEYIEQFNSSDTATKLGVYAFPTYSDKEFYMSVGDFTTEDDALNMLTQLQNYYILNAEISSPDKDMLTVHTDEYKILLETDDSANLQIHTSDNQVISNLSNEDYYGYFSFYRENSKEKDAIQVINTLDIDGYVKSVLSVELASSYSAEMLKASAVVFRTAAYKKLIDHKLRNFDVCADSHCQKYIGCAAVSDRISNAVDAVKGIVLTYDSELIYPVYSKSCGSTTVSLKDAIGKDIGYLKSVQTNWEMIDSVYADWKYSISPSELYNKLYNAGYTGLESSVKSITVNSRSDNSIYVTRITFTDILGNSVTVEGSERIRTVLDGIVDSAAFIVGKSGSTVSYTYYGESGEMVEGKTTLEGVVGNFVFSGEGIGSGVGYSLSGAQILAEQGIKYDEILTRYYQGTELSDLK